jgi:hypothetical protein
MIPVWLWDTGAGIAGFHHPYGLTNFRQLDVPIVVGGIVASKNMSVKTTAVLDNINVLYDSRLGANCLPSSVIVDAGWKVNYSAATDSYSVTTASGKLLTFQRFVMNNGAVTKHYLCHPGLPPFLPSEPPEHTIAATSVQGNLTMHTKQDAKSAAIAQRFLTKMGGSAAHGIIRLPQLRGITITSDHVRKAQEIYGPVRSHAQSVATSVQDVAITTELPAARPKPTPQALAADLCLIMGVWVVMGIFLPCRYVAVAPVKDRSALEVFAAIKGMIFSAMKRNFDVIKFQADGERGIHSSQLDELCATHRIQIVKVGAGQHEANAERSIRNLKAEVRNIAQRVIPRSLPKELLEQLIIAAAASINGRLSSSLIGDKSPQQLWNGSDHAHAQDHDLAFGDLALANCPNQKNNVNPRADTVMVLWPTYSQLHGYHCFKLGTNAYVVRNHNTLREIPWTRGDQAAIESLGDHDPHGVDMPSREQGIASGVHIHPSHEPAPEVTVVDVTEHEEPVQLPPHRPGPQREAPVAGVTMGSTIDAPAPTPTLVDRNISPASVVHPETVPELPMTSDVENIPPPPRSRRTATTSTLLSLPAPPVHHTFQMSVKKALRDRPVEAKAAITSEMRQMLQLKVWTPVNKSQLSEPERKRIIRSSMFVKEKWAPSGEFLKHKARLVAGGDLQDKSLYDNISSPTATPTSILHVAGQAAMESRHVATVDIGGAYLNADMNPKDVPVDMVIEPVLATILTNIDPLYLPFVRQDGSIVVRLLKALYGTVQAARLWHDMIVNILTSYGFVQNPYDKCVLNKRDADGGVTTVALYVDDLLITSTSELHTLRLKAHLESQFKEVTYHSGKILDYVGMTMDFQTNPGMVRVTMKQNVDAILADARPPTTSAAHPLTPASAELFDITPESQRLSMADEKYFRTFVARALYVAKRVRPEILTAIAFLTTRAHICTEEDMCKLNRVVGYLRGAPDRGIIIDFGPNPVTKSYLDAAYGLHKHNGKSHSGGFAIVGRGGPLFVTSNAQGLVTKSSTEAELVAVSDIASEVIALRSFGIAQGLSAAPAIIYQDNNSTMSLIARGGPCSKRSRHIDIRHFWMAERVRDSVVAIVRCPTEIMWANILTKAVQGAQFIAERTGLTNWK